MSWYKKYFCEYYFSNKTNWNILYVSRESSILYKKTSDQKPHHDVSCVLCDNQKSLEETAHLFIKLQH